MRMKERTRRGRPPTLHAPSTDLSHAATMCTGWSGPQVGQAVLGSLGCRHSLGLAAASHERSVRPQRGRLQRQLPSGRRGLDRRLGASKAPSTCEPTWASQAGGKGTDVIPKNLDFSFLARTDAWEYGLFVFLATTYDF